MVKRIKPISKVIRVDAEVSRIRSRKVVRLGYAAAWDLHWIPRVDIYERGEEIFVEAEIPGVSASEVEITVQSNRVEIKGRKKETFSSKRIKFLRLEREFGTFRRLITLPGTVVPDKARAFLSNGVLKLCLKKYLVEEDKDGRKG